MDQLKEKVTLHTPGDHTAIAVKQLRVVLHWRAAVDLDLMAFYLAKNGNIGGVFSDNYPGGTLGSLSHFPYIQLSGDSGVDTQDGDHEEILTIGRLHDLSEVYICTINYTDAIARQNSAFADYDGGVLVTDDSGHSVAVPLNATQSGQVAVVARIEIDDLGNALLRNENRVLSLGEFFKTIPGSDLLRAGSTPPTSHNSAPPPAASVNTAMSRWIEGIRLRGYENPYLDKTVEKEILREAVAQGISFDDARAQLLQTCETEHYALASHLEEQAALALESCIESQGAIDQACFNNAVTLTHRAGHNHLSEDDCRQRVKALILARQWAVRQGFLKGGSWFSDI